MVKGRKAAAKGKEDEVRIKLGLPFNEKLIIASKQLDRFIKEAKEGLIYMKVAWRDHIHGDTVGAAIHMRSLDEKKTPYVILNRGLQKELWIIGGN